MEKIKIKKFIIDEIKEHGLKDAPIEACGYLAGIKRDNIILKSIKMKNVDNSPEHFSFDVKEQFAVMKNLRNEGLEILGVYHTHPITAARMSEEDIRLANDINLIYLIYSLKGNNYKCFKVTKEKLIIQIEVEEV